MAAYKPFRLSEANAFSNRCVFMTGGPRAYLPGLSCVLRQMRAVGSAHQIMVVVPEEDAAHMAPEVALHRNAQLVIQIKRQTKLHGQLVRSHAGPQPQCTDMPRCAPAVKHI